VGRGYGFGKVILFNEHFVVYGIPGVVSATDSATDSIVKKIPKGGIIIRDERSGSVGYTESKKIQQKESIDRMLKSMGLDPRDVSLDIWIGGNLPGFSGLGASAASSVAIARAMAGEFGMKLSDERINEIAYEAEKAYAGNPSGIDNTAATFGGLLWFKKNPEGKDTMEKLDMPNAVEIVLANSGIVADTKEMVLGVAERRRKYPEKYDLLFKQAEELAFKARDALERFDLERVGELMNENHRLLQGIEVSCKELDHLVELSIEQGAIGAKMTGGGGGGCMVALTPGKELQEKVATAIEKEGFKVLRTKIGIKKEV
jgi:mevalonate kinase